MKKLFIGSLPWSTTDEQLKELFETMGAVESANVVTERDTGRSRGFGFVEMTNDDEAKAAIEKLNGHELEGRTITVNEARAKE